MLNCMRKFNNLGPRKLCHKEGSPQYFYGPGGWGVFRNVNFIRESTWKFILKWLLRWYQWPMSSFDNNFLFLGIIYHTVSCPQPRKCVLLLSENFLPWDSSHSCIQMWGQDPRVLQRILWQQSSRENFRANSTISDWLCFLHILTSNDFYSFC